MIGWLQGTIMDKQHPGKMVINVNGVGYDVETSLQTFFNLESQTSESIGLHIHTVVREDALLLYGFVNRQERALFRNLIKINGIGPKVAMSILSSVSVGEFIQGIHQQNTAMLSKIPGIGKKTAERLVIEMKDSIKQFDSMNMEAALSLQTSSTSPQRDQAEAISALEALGYKPQEAMRAVAKVDDGNKSCEQLIRQALQILAAR
ncbi:Holliday junction branch migration protein RuvA [Legionella spiritensis]|uniref:Holliday junction branch migration complex subunit RuvA n=1 Tax=Legionella spiritensis TaxID=452 RepID=A0A0W0Z8S6_LEGSP|nr:Holliday junction branch migration protein RuvA [Legionella spiritensis]KTD65466.1 Holliday junction DNA helicase RuvA [Legionella spiritensis]SNV35787.1 Holliday junction ATP-dependent DNA helicase RuvA [Legionella spiritensis]VEG89855.1 Holliday junction ATP-dependent DNA helicase RuvA [Legionella spiritensis]